MSPSIVALARDALLRRLGLLDGTARAIVSIATFAAIRFGAEPKVVKEAQRRDLPLNRALQIVQWSLAAEGRARFPHHFSPGDHLEDPTARAAAVKLLHRFEQPSADLKRQLIGLDDQSGLPATLDAIERDLQTAIGATATRPKRGKGIDSGRQLAVLSEVVGTLESAGLRPFLMSGTLLGFIRDGHFMSHDYDIDLGLLPAADPEAAHTALAELESFSVRTEGPRIIATHQSAVTVDVFTHELRDGRFWHATRIHEWWNTPFDLDRRELDGVSFWIPTNPKLYLDENYGDWHRPVPFYDISFDTPNRRYIEGLDAVRFLHSRCIQAMDKGDRWLLEAAARELRDNFAVDITDLLAASPLLTTHRGVGDPDH